MNKHIYIYSPSSAVRDKAGFQRGLKRLTTLGYDVEVDEAALATHQRFAGDDETRVAAIHRAACSGASVALISRGGYGVTRILPAIDYKVVGKALGQGTRFVGFSDFTAFQLAVLAKTGEITWAGPALLDDFGNRTGCDEIMQACFDDLVTGQGEGCGWKLPKKTTSLLACQANDSGEKTNYRNSDIQDAMLWGGNLAMLVSLLGTPYLPIVKNGIMFLEDVGEHPYKVERMLAQLLQAGILARQKAIIFGHFSNYKLASHDKGFKLASVMQWLQSQVKARILTGLPFGHVATKVLLPVGMKISLATEDRNAFLLWGHQH